MEVWQPLHDEALLTVGLVELDPGKHRIIDTDIPVSEIGTEWSDLLMLVLLLESKTRSGNQECQIKHHDLIVIPGTPHVLLLHKTPELPEDLLSRSFALGACRYAIVLNDRLRNGTLHPCYRSLPVTHTG